MVSEALSKTERFKALLEIGYFPQELPPPFQTRDLAKYRNSIDRAWQSNSYPKSAPEIFSVPRVGGWRRDLSIVNPVAQFFLSKLIAEEWITLRKHLNKSNFSVQRLEITKSKLRSIQEPDFRLISMLKSEIAGLYDYALVSDISRFYGTLYTYAIPWALHGKGHCKTILDTPAYKQLLGTKLDVAVRKGNENQTAGIPIGPDTSRILSEIVVSEVDRNLSKKLNLKGPRAIRNVDDWFIGFDSLGEAEESIAALSLECQIFQLEIHPGKTMPIDLAKSFSSPWTNDLLSVQVPKSEKKQQKQIEQFFELAFELSSKNASANVLKFALTLVRSWDVSKSNWRIFENFLLRAVRANKTTLPQFVQLIANYREKGFEISQNKMFMIAHDFKALLFEVGHFFALPCFCWGVFCAVAGGMQSGL